MASLGSSIRSAARATFSAYRTIPIRWRLAGGSAFLTFVILAGFAAIVGVLTDRQVRGQFNDSLRSEIQQLHGELNGQMAVLPEGITRDCDRTVHLSDFASAEHAQIRIFNGDDTLCTQNQVKIKGATAVTTKPAFRNVFPAGGTSEQYGYRVEELPLQTRTGNELTLLYARPLSDIDHELARVQFVLLLGVLGGTVLALLAGLANAQRAMRPVVALTLTAREIERTRDPSLRIPHPEAEDEVAELARTLEGMLGALDDARAQTQSMLDRQREFVADASHELRTPLTSVLANLELLAEELDGEQADSANSALRATRRMRRLVGDLLLLARADAKRSRPQRPTDLATVVTEAAAELGPLADEHELTIVADPAVVPGIRDDLHRMVLNLLENAVQHTPPGTTITAATRSDGHIATVSVEDDGPGIDPALEGKVFDRFVRGAGDGGRGSGLGLAIVRAVVQSHGGAVMLQHPESGHGTRFVIEIPQQAVSELAPVQTSTTTGRTMGRRRSRS